MKLVENERISYMIINNNFDQGMSGVEKEVRFSV